MVVNGVQRLTRILIINPFHATGLFHSHPFSLHILLLHNNENEPRSSNDSSLFHEGQVIISMLWVEYFHILHILVVLLVLNIMLKQSIWKKSKRETKKRKPRKDKATDSLEALSCDMNLRLNVSRCQHSSTQNLKFLPEKKMQKNRSAQPSL